jgi:hypothetical protein
MSGLVLALWIIYLSECFVRWRPGQWIFRPRLNGRLEAAHQPDISFLDGRFSFVWTTALPWRAALVFSGDSFDRKSTDERLRQVRTACRTLRLLSSALFALILIVFPALVLSEHFVPAAPAFICAVALAWVATLAGFFHAHRRLNRSWPKLESWLVAALSPLTLIRAHQIVTSSAPLDAHPGLAAALLCDDGEFLRVARLWHFDRPELRPAIAEVACERGLLEALFAPPRVVEPGVSRFCQRCHATYHDRASRCADCDGVELTRLDAVALH